MEILGIGTDIVECLRIGRMIEEHGECFLTRVYTEREIRHCHARKRAIEHFAGLWAAKEAVLKSLGMMVRRGACWTEVEVRPFGLHMQEASGGGRAAAGPARRSGTRHTRSAIR